MDQNNKILEKNTQKCKYCPKITNKSKKGGLRKKWGKNTQKMEK